jgi:hypothetical protein
VTRRLAAGAAVVITRRCSLHAGLGEDRLGGVNFLPAGTVAEESSTKPLLMRLLKPAPPAWSSTRWRAPRGGGPATVRRARCTGRGEPGWAQTEPRWGPGCPRGRRPRRRRRRRQRRRWRLRPYLYLKTRIRLNLLRTRFEFHQTPCVHGLEKKQRHTRPQGAEAIIYRRSGECRASARHCIRRVYPIEGVGRRLSDALLQYCAVN